VFETTTKLLNSTNFNTIPTRLTSTIVDTAKNKYISLISLPPFSQRPKFIRDLDTFDWKNFSLAISQKNHKHISEYINELILRLTPYLKEPLASINLQCKPPPLRRKEQIKCKNGTEPHEKKIGLLLQLGFDVDTLEIHLNELDRFFIIESTKTHSRFYSKPLMWEQVKNQGRFIKFIPKVVHFVVDDAEIVTVMSKLSLENSSMINFDSERLQEKLLWSKFLKWNNATKFFNETDLLGWSIQIM
jgi:hypothetical protein